MPEFSKREIEKHINKNTLSITVRPSSNRNEVLGWDEERKTLKINVAAPPDKDKANKELTKFLTKILKQKVRLKLGARSREKVVELL